MIAKVSIRKIGRSETVHGVSTRSVLKATFLNASYLELCLVGR